MINDPYKILGVMPSASDDEIKTAYKDLIRQYSGDSERIMEITNAYDAVMDQRRGGTEQSGGNSFAEVRRLLGYGSYNDAAAVLDQIQDRTAEWYFLNGSICYARGWLNDAYSSFEQACRMEPYNPEYNSALRHMKESQRGDMRGDPNEQGFGNGTRPVGGCSACDICNGLICADCCCECMGGDFIPCC